MFPLSDSLKTRVDILYRIPYSFFIFVRNTSKVVTQPFVANAEIALEILDKSKVSVGRTLVDRSLYADVSDPDSLRQEYLMGGTSVSLSPGDYTLAFEVDDKESRRHFLDDHHTIVVQKKSDQPLRLADLIFIQPGSQSDSLFAPMDYDDAIPLGTNARIIAQVEARIPQDSIRTSVHIFRLNGRDIPLPRSAVDSAFLHPSLKPGALEAASSDSGFLYREKRSGSTTSYLLTGTIGTESLEQGEYELSVTLEGDHVSSTYTHRFAIRWFDMPRSLRNPEMAIPLLHYIMPKEEYEKLQHASERERDTLFKEFWKKKDPTPKTAFNEVMAEFYNRADYAFSHFSTFQHHDGTETDRGRAYILFGPPSSVHDEMQPSAPPREIWEYAMLHKRLVFVDVSRQGDFTLVSQDEQ